MVAGAIKARRLGSPAIDRGKTSRNLGNTRKRGNLMLDPDRHGRQDPSTTTRPGGLCA